MISPVVRREISRPERDPGLLLIDRRELTRSHTHQHRMGFPLERKKPSYNYRDTIAL